MGANCNTCKYPAGPGKESVTKLWEQDCATSLHENGHSYSGEIGMLQGKPEFIDKMYSTEREAEDYISEHHEKWRRPLAVSYSGADGVKYWVVGGWCSS